MTNIESRAMIITSPSGDARFWDGKDSNGVVSWGPWSIVDQDVGDKTDAPNNLDGTKRIKG
jgi:hypothetical protein